MIVLLCKKRDRERLGTIHDKTREHFTFVASSVGITVDGVVQIMSQLFSQHDGNRFAVGRGHPVGIEVNGGFARGAYRRKRTFGTLQLSSTA